MPTKVHFIDRFLVFEEKYELFNLQVLNCHIWPVIRFNLYSLLLQKEYGTQEGHPKESFTSSLRGFFVYFFPSIFNLFFFLRKGKETVILNHKRKVKNAAGFFECKYTEFLTGSDACVLEAPFNNRHFKPSNTPNVVYLDLILNIARLYSVFGRKKKIGASDLSKLERLHAELNSEFGLSIWDFNALVLKMLYKYKAISYFAKRILGKLRANRLIVTVSYSDVNLPFIEQAKLRGMKVIEIQHGIMGLNHIAYNYLNKKEHLWFPDVIWVWSTFWKESSRFPISAEEVLIKGFPFLERYKKAWDKQDRGKNQVLIVSQGPYSDRIMEFACRLKRKIDSTEFKILYKPHPSEFVSGVTKFDILANAGISVSTESNIYDLFASSIAQIGVNSTALFEGLEFGLKTFILDVGDISVWKGFDGVFVVDDEDDILMYLSEFASTK